MGRFAFVNGRYVPHAQANIHINDRGYQLADGIYEVVPVEGGYPIDLEPHFERMERSLTSVRIGLPMSLAAIKIHALELMRRNRLGRGIVYIQITRGVAPREHRFPTKMIKASLIMTTTEMPPLPKKLREEGVTVITIPDLRWQRCNIKSISLLPNVLGKQQAVEAHAFEAWLEDKNGNITEGTSTNAWIVCNNTEIRTRPLSGDILGGIVRHMALKIAAEQGLRFVEKPFSTAEALAADEAFLTSSTCGVLPVSKINNHPIGGGKVGAVTRQLAALYDSHILRQIPS